MNIPINPSDTDAPSGLRYPRKKDYCHSWLKYGFCPKSFLTEESSAYACSDEIDDGIRNRYADDAEVHAEITTPSSPQLEGGAASGITRGFNTTSNGVRDPDCVCGFRHVYPPSVTALERQIHAQKCEFMKYLYGNMTFREFLIEQNLTLEAIRTESLIQANLIMEKTKEYETLQSSIRDLQTANLAELENREKFQHGSGENSSVLAMAAASLSVTTDAAILAATTAAAAGTAPCSALPPLENWGTVVSSSSHTSNSNSTVESFNTELESKRSQTARKMLNSVLSDPPGGSYRPVLPSIGERSSDSEDYNNGLPLSLYSSKRATGYGGPHIGQPPDRLRKRRSYPCSSPSSDRLQDMAEPKRPRQSTQGPATNLEHEDFFSRRVKADKSKDSSSNWSADMDISITTNVPYVLGGFANLNRTNLERLGSYQIYNNFMTNIHHVSVASMDHSQGMPLTRNPMVELTQPLGGPPSYNQCLSEINEKPLHVGQGIASSCSVPSSVSSLSCSGESSDNEEDGGESNDSLESLSGSGSESISVSDGSRCSGDVSNGGDVDER